MTRAETNAADSTGQSDADEQGERLAALLLTMDQPCRPNYTVALSQAKWLIAEADRVGWALTIQEA